MKPLEKIREMIETFEHKPRIWRVGVDAIFNNTESPAGMMDGRETASTISSHGLLYARARSADEAHVKVEHFIRAKYLEPLLNLTYWNTREMKPGERAEYVPLLGLTER